MLNAVLVNIVSCVILSPIILGIDEVFAECIPEIVRAVKR